MSVASGAGLGAYEVFTTTGRGHPVEFWVDDAMRQIVSVSSTAPPPVREQALAYAEQIRAVLVNGMANAIRSDRTTLVHHLNKAGMPEAAALIQSITTRS